MAMEGESKLLIATHFMLLVLAILSTLYEVIL